MTNLKLISSHNKCRGVKIQSMFRRQTKTANGNMTNMSRWCKKAITQATTDIQTNHSVALPSIRVKATSVGATTIISHGIIDLHLSSTKSNTTTSHLIVNKGTIKIMVAAKTTIIQTLRAGIIHSSNMKLSRDKSYPITLTNLLRAITIICRIKLHITLKGPNSTRNNNLGKDSTIQACKIHLKNRKLRSGTIKKC